MKHLLLVILLVLTAGCTVTVGTPESGSKGQSNSSGSEPHQPNESPPDGDSVAPAWVSDEAWADDVRQHPEFVGVDTALLVEAADNICFLASADTPQQVGELLVETGFSVDAAAELMVMSVYYRCPERKDWLDANAAV